MNITRHNYETFFLLYVDKELSAAERKAVDVFVQENPDLHMELVLLQQTVVKADDTVLDKKDWLYMEEDISALQENLMFYADDELDGAAKKTVESIIASDKAAQAEWAVLQQTKLNPDMDIVYPDKPSLYRKEPGRVVVIKWWRVAAAAVLLGISLWTGMTVYKNNNTINTGKAALVNSNKINTGAINGNAASGITPVTGYPAGKSAAENTAVTTTRNVDNGQVPERIKPAVEKNIDPIEISPKENTTAQNKAIKKPDNNLPKPALQNINTVNSNEVTAQNVLPANNSSSRVSGNNDAVVKTNPKENRAIIESVNNGKTDPAVTALQVVNNNATADGENNNRYLDLDNDKQKRTALGGFIRKAKRMLERNTNVKTGEGIKIAAFEIALK
jgi:hypothetical protein